MNKIEKDFYAAAAKEIANRQVDLGLMSRAYSDCEGNEAKAKALYIKLRVAQLIENLRQEGAASDFLKKESELRQKAVVKDAHKDGSVFWEYEVQTKKDGVFKLCSVLVGLGLMGLFFLLSFLLHNLG
jgi:hypothetical protein